MKNKTFINHKYFKTYRDTELREQYMFEFENNYGASVLYFKHPALKINNFELAVFYDGRIYFNSPISNDVLQGLDTEEVLDILEEIKGLE